MGKNGREKFRGPSRTSQKVDKNPRDVNEAANVQLKHLMNAKFREIRLRPISVFIEVDRKLH
jgi:hypothetical protein